MGLIMAKATVHWFTACNCIETSKCPVVTKFLCLARGTVSQVLTAQANKTSLEYAAGYVKYDCSLVSLVVKF